MSKETLKDQDVAALKEEKTEALSDEALEEVTGGKVFNPRFKH